MHGKIPKPIKTKATSVLFSLSMAQHSSFLSNTRLVTPEIKNQ